MEKANSNHWVEEIIYGVPEGTRHSSAVSLVGRWYGKGLCQTEVRMLLVLWNQLNLPPLGDQELKSIYYSTKKWENPKQTAPISDTKARKIIREVNHGGHRFPTKLV
ncbi:primase alpha helix C-terminal domain-containing protein [Chloroflexota bacterium]